MALACGGSGSSDAALEDGGQPAHAGGPASRIVSLSPSTTELLFSIGAGARLVGRTQYCNTPEAALEVPSVGDGLNPNVELIASLRPDLVVLYQSGANAPARERLEALGIATITVALDRLGDLERVALLLGDLTGQRAQADSLVRRFRADLDQTRLERMPKAPRVLMLTWDAPPIVIGGGSFLDEIVELAGGQNVFGDLLRPSAPVSIEAIAARAPDVVLVIGDADLSFADRPEWHAVEAVRRRRFATVQGTEFSWPSFRAPAAVAQLRTRLAGQSW
jgi:ABC-type Fe3+-hydroxamate transport system substrate-binding protein